jgi:transposase-like protein
MNNDTKTCPVCRSLTERITVNRGGAVETRYVCKKCGYRLNRNYGEQT